MNEFASKRLQFPTDHYNTPYRYYVNGLDVTWYVMNDLPIPAEYGERFFGVEVK